MTHATATQTAPKRKSLFALVGDVPRLVSELVKSEIELAKAEVVRKLKAAGIGAGLLAGAAILALYFVGLLLTAIVFALSLVMPGWLAALIVAVVLLAIAVVLALMGKKKLEAGMPPVPEDALRGVQRDVNVLKRMGARR